MRMTTRSPRWAPAAAGALVLALATVGAADEPSEELPVRLAWEAPAGCPTGPRVAAELRRLLRDRPPSPSDEAVEARAVVERRTPERWTLELHTRRGELRGTRTLEGESCVAVAEATVVILLLMVDPAASPAEAPDLSEPLPEAPPKPDPPAPDPVPVAASRARPRPRARAPASPAAPPVAASDDPCGWPAAIAAFAAGDLGAMPAPSAGAALAVGLRPCRWRLEVGARLFPARRTQVGDGDAGGVLWLLAGTAGAGFAATTGTFEVGPRASFELGAMWGRGVGVRTPQSSSVPWVAVTAGGFASVALMDPLRLRLDLEALVPFYRPLFVLDRIGAVHRASPVGGRLALGLELIPSGAW